MTALEIGGGKEPEIAKCHIQRRLIPQSSFVGTASIRL
jgi:hypothetical protein